ncbi:TIR domain-containing protein [Nonomuraea sp. MG754425]|uniref:toll/interleukin-1 receptor domain-containing protein n=1 Tax=Nonomuraea sp. MG754425 TaxID=2570319 RepID=UPI002A07870E|nr:TIR domain-containing protein [Nonomuraea sp. MG754425]
MADIFINFRSDDTAAAAALLDSELSRRFGSAQIFLAKRSIKPGRKFSEALLGAVRNCSVLLALIGPNWLAGTTTKGQRLIDDESDWVRREIIEALTNEVHIVPVVIGRRTPSLRTRDLPDALTALAALQNRRIDLDDPTPGLTRLGDDLAELIPHLVDQGRPEIRPGRDSPTIGTIIYGANGPIHTGSGDQHIRYEGYPPDGGR